MEKKENQNPEKKLPSIGVLLKTARERKGQTLEAITNILCIRLKHLKAIEDGKYEELPGKTYAIGFVKAYSEHLGLDGDEVVRLFKEEVIELKKKQELYIIESGSEASAPSYFAVFIAVVLAFLAYFAWNNVTNYEQQEIDIIDDIPKEVAEVIKNQPETPEIIIEEEKIAVEIKPSLPNIEKETKPIGTVVEKPEESRVEKEVVIENKIIEEALNEPEKIVATQVVTLEAKTEVEVQVEEILPPQEVKERTPVIYGQENTNSRILLKANDDSWVHIVGKRETGEDIIFISKLLYKDDTYYLPNRNDLLLDTGNAGGVDLFVDGLKIEALGAKGAVKRNISLIPEELLKKTVDTNLNQN